MGKKVIIGIVGIAVVLALISVIVVVILLNQDKVSPEEVLKNYMSCVENKDYEGMYELTDGMANKEFFISRNKNIYEGIEAYNIKAIVAKTSNNNGVTEVVYTNYMNTVAGEMSFVNTAYMVKEDGYYKIKWSSSLIYPELTEVNKIRVLTLPAKRGTITDRNNNILAEDGVASQIGLVPGKMVKETKNVDIAKVAELLGVSVDYINKSLSASYVKEDTFVPLKTVTKDEIILKQKLLEIKGVKIVDSDERIYPYGEAISHLVGYVQEISSDELENKKQEEYTSSSVIGKAGLEKIYEEKLRGIDGKEIYITDGNDVKIKTIASKNFKNGENIKTTIDVKLQKNIYDEYANDNSATVVINPKTGEILAAVSTPTFNPNDFSLGMSDEKWNSLNQNENKPLYNRILSNYTPGSSFKPINGAIGLSYGAYREDDDFGKSSMKWQLDSSWGDFYVTTLTTYTGIANLRNALIYSDNIYFAKAALKVGRTKFTDKLKGMGFNEEIETEIGTIKSSYSNTGEIASDIELANSGYGQAEMLINPLHMAMLYSAFVNDGSMINPYILYKDNASPTIYKSDVISQESANIIKNNLIQVIENPNGTGYGARTEGMILAGKTGTAEVKDSKNDQNGTEIGWFNCFTADRGSEKQFMIISMVEDVKNKGGSHYVVNKVKKVLNQM